MQGDERRGVGKETYDLLVQCYKEAWDAIETLRRCGSRWADEVPAGNGGTELKIFKAYLGTKGPEITEGAGTWRGKKEWLRGETEQLLRYGLLSMVHKVLHDRANPEVLNAHNAAETMGEGRYAIGLWRNAEELEALWRIGGELGRAYTLVPERTRTGPHCIFRPDEVVSVIDRCSKTDWLDGKFDWPGRATIRTERCAAVYATRGRMNTVEMHTDHVQLIRCGAVLTREQHAEFEIEEGTDWSRYAG